MHKHTNTIAAFLILSCLVACQEREASNRNHPQSESTTAPTPEKPKEDPMPVGVTVEQIKADLVGKQFFWNYRWGSGGQKWAVREGHIQDLVVDKRLTDSSSGTDEIHALTTLSDGALIVRGIIVFQYKKFDQGWALLSVEPRDGGPGESFSFEVLQGLR